MRIDPRALCVALFVIGASAQPGLTQSKAPGSVDPPQATAPVPSGTVVEPAELEVKKKKVVKRRVHRRYVRYEASPRFFLIPPPRYWFRPWPRHRYYGYGWRHRHWHHRRHYYGFPFFRW